MRIESYIYGNVLKFRGIRRECWSAIRQLWIRWWNDPACQMNVHGRALRMPLSHALPSYWRKFPLYDRLPARLADFLRNRHGRLVAVDVGANIGDTVAALFGGASDRILAIEPNPRFLQYLKLNWGSVANIDILNCLCSSTCSSGRYEVHEQTGTASLESAEAGIPLQARRLDDIMADHPEYGELNLLKIDTDGHDFEVLEGARASIRNAKPAVYFECDSFGCPDYVERCLETLAFFAEDGYAHFLLYDNFGRLMGRYDIGDSEQIKKLLFYQMASQNYYYDILVMRNEDLNSFYRSEKEFFVNALDSALRKTARYSLFSEAASGGGETGR